MIEQMVIEQVQGKFVGIRTLRTGAIALYRPSSFNPVSHYMGRWFLLSELYQNISVHNGSQRMEFVRQRMA